MIWHKKSLLLSRWLLPACFFICLQLPGCCANETYAPVVNAWQDPDAMKSKYRVQNDDTIYSIALAFDVDFRDLAKANGLTPPYRLKQGQMLTMVIKPCASEDVTASPCCEIGVKSNTMICEDVTPVPRTSISNRALPLSSKTELLLPEIELKTPVPISRSPTDSTCQPTNSCVPKKTAESNPSRIPGHLAQGRWQWPAKGRVVKEFCLQPGGSKGIDVAGELGDPVMAAAAGKVVYSGSGLRGYGNLIIIKHSDNFLSAYAYNKKLLVKEGDVVRAGAEIAKMGQNNTGQVLLHFEIRLNGKPVNPLLYL